MKIFGVIVNKGLTNTILYDIIKKIERGKKNDEKTNLAF
jgi:hypothetical protein